MGASLFSYYPSRKVSTTATLALVRTAFHEHRTNLSSSDFQPSRRDPEYPCLQRPLRYDDLGPDSRRPPSTND